MNLPTLESVLLDMVGANMAQEARRRLEVERSLARSLLVEALRDDGLLGCLWKLQLDGILAHGEARFHVGWWRLSLVPGVRLEVWSPDGNSLRNATTPIVVVEGGIHPLVAGLDSEVMTICEGDRVTLAEGELARLAEFVEAR